MTAQGHPRAIYQRAIERGNLAVAETTLRELGRPSLGELLELTALAFLAPIALTTSALDAPLGDARANRRFNDCRDEALAIAKAEGATIDDATLIALQQAAPAEMRSSMQKT